jgi:hypothetical protein
MAGCSGGSSSFFLQCWRLHRQENGASDTCEKSASSLELEKGYFVLFVMMSFVIAVIFGAALVARMLLVPTAAATASAYDLAGQASAATKGEGCIKRRTESQRLFCTRHGKRSHTSIQRSGLSGATGEVRSLTACSMCCTGALSWANYQYYSYWPAEGVWGTCCVYEIDKAMRDTAGPPTRDA